MAENKHRGRPPLPRGEKKVGVRIMLRPETIAWMDSRRAEHGSRAVQVEAALQLSRNRQEANDLIDMMVERGIKRQLEGE